MEYTTYGKMYTLVLNNDGKIECKELGIVGDGVEEVKAAIRSTIDKERSAPRIKILTFGDGFRKKDTIYFEGTTSGAKVGSSSYPQYWVSWKDERGKNQRGKMSGYYFFLDTEENRVILNRICDLRRSIENMEKEISDLNERLVRIGGKE